jgi:hypothetical protein
MNGRGYITLKQVIEEKIVLSDLHVNNFKRLIGDGLRAQHRKDAVVRLTLRTLHSMKSHPAYARIHFDVSGRCELVAGQDYVSEMRHIKNLLFA